MLIRVGFLFSESILGWNGGINYYRNIFRILGASGQYEVVVFCPSQIIDDIRKLFGEVEIVSANCLSRYSLRGVCRKAAMYLFRKAWFIDAILRNNHIDIVSHTEIPVTGASIPVFGWIPDFQMHRLPAFFPNKKGIERRRFVNELLIKNSFAIFVSSADAKKDLMAFYPSVKKEKIDVLQFTIPPIGASKYDKKILDRFSLCVNKYFLVTNQFWMHKNHILVIEALAQLLKRYGTLPFKVAATGRLDDPRDKAYVSRVRSMLAQDDLDKLFIPTGEISYSEVCALRHFSIAVIQPSLFEGWNTTVEECKAIGKKILLSDLPIHREQAPENAAFFNPHDVIQLANLLYDTYARYNPERERECEAYAMQTQQERWKTFSDTYLKILEDCLN